MPMALDTSLWGDTRSSSTPSPALRRTSTFSSKQTPPTRKRRMPRSPRSAHRSKAFGQKTSPSAAVSFVLGSDPHGFDILPDIPGVDFDAAWERRVEGVIDPASGLKAFFISAPDLIASKLAAGRPQDIADAAAIREAAEETAQETSGGARQGWAEAVKFGCSTPQKKGRQSSRPAAALSLGCLEGTAVLRNLSAYCRSLVTSCCTWLACASAAMPVWLRISYFDMFEVAEA